MRLRSANNISVADVRSVLLQFYRCRGPAQWTAKFLVNVVAEQFTVNGTTTDTLVYATNPTITGFGIGATGIPEDQYIFDHPH